MTASPTIAAPAAAGWYRAVWRWHFYASLFCIPFVIWLAATGSIYLWRPQIEAWLDRPYDQVAATGALATPEQRVAAALHAVPGATFGKYVLRANPHQAQRILVNLDGVEKRVYVDPHDLKVLHIVTEEHRPMRRIFHLHGQLMAGAAGSFLVETAACWAIIMLLTGLYLWWPRGGGLGGVLYPRLQRRGRALWRDVHAVAGVWVAGFALVMILSGLPWSQGWGNYLLQLRSLTGSAPGPIDWTIGGRDISEPPQTPPANADTSDLARVIATARNARLSAPVLVIAPRAAGAPWRVSSDAANRPARADIDVDGASGRLLGRVDFAQRHWIDRAVGYGIAWHEGAFFGLANQLFNTLVALALIALAMSGAVMWWQRRPTGTLGAPPALPHPRAGALLVAAIAVLALLLPMFGATLVAVLLADWLAHRRRPAV